MVVLWASLYEKGKISVCEVIDMKTVMKTATVTWINYNNYGTLLQAYALQKAIEQLGHENEIISDAEVLKAFRAAHPGKPRPIVRLELEGLSDKLLRVAGEPGRVLRSILARTSQEAYAMPYESSQNACDIFRREKLKIRNDISPRELPELNGQYDAFVCGSDQIWSVFEENFNPYYYLDFVTGKKIAYAPSLGTDRIPEETAAKIRELLRDFSGLSAREEASARQLAEITSREVPWVCDPTLLHDRSFWADFAGDVAPVGKKYLLCYFLEDKPWYFSYARELSKKLGLTLLLIPNKWEHLQHSFVVKKPVGPETFVSLFQHADYVLTDSYHGSIFSMIFEKDFQYLQRFAEEDPYSQNIRVESLFGYLGLKDRVVKQDSIIENLWLPYDSIKQRMVEFGSHSVEFLEMCMKG